MAEQDGEGSNAVDTARIATAVRELLTAIGDDPDRPGLQSTPERVAASYAEFFSGIGVDPLIHLDETADVADADMHPGQIVLVKGIRFRSMCEHHLLPFLGVAHIAYIPRDRVVGLGKLPRVVDTLASRPQLQERLTEQVADAVQAGVDALGVLVVMEARHGCVVARGGRHTGSTTMTIASRGQLAETARRAEVLRMIDSPPLPDETGA